MNKKTTNKPNVCFVSHFVYPLFNRRRNFPFGGKEVQFYLLTKELSSNLNFSINVLTGDRNLKSRRIERYNNLKLYISLPIKNKYVNKIKGIINFLLTLIQMNPDIVIQRGGGILTGLSALYSKIFRKKFIFSIAHRNDVIKMGKKGLMRLFHWYGISNADYIIAQNFQQIQDYERWKKKKIFNIKLIMSGYQIKSYDLNNKKYILWVSRADKWKRPELFIKLTDKFPTIKFLMICSKGKDKNYWNQIYFKAKKRKNIKFYEFIPFHKIDKTFNKAKIFINTSTFEGFPNTFIQSLLNGTPIISLNVDPDDFLILNKCGFNCKDDFKKLVKYLKLLLDDDKLYFKYSKNGYDFVKENNDIKKISHLWSILIKNIINV